MRDGLGHLSVFFLFVVVVSHTHIRKAAAHSFVLAENIASGEILVTPDFVKKLKQEKDPTLLSNYGEVVEVVGTEYRPFIVAEPEKVSTKLCFVVPAAHGCD